MVSLNLAHPVYVCGKSELIICFFSVDFAKKEPCDLRQMYPSAAAKAIRLIGQMLKMEPGSRISAEDALNDPYLSRYHDPDDEPMCVPAFDFGFEKQVRQRHYVFLSTALGRLCVVLCLTVNKTS